MSLDGYKNEYMQQDASLYPSYTNLVIPYRVKCRERYYRSGRIQRRQLIKELKRLELLQIRALDGVKIHKEFCENVQSSPEKDDDLSFTTRQKRRLLYIMENEII